MGPQPRPLALALILALTLALVALTSVAPPARGDALEGQDTRQAKKQDKAEELFDEIYKRSAPIESTLKTVKAHFVEETVSSLLAKPLIAEGTLEASRPSDLLLTYTKPEQKTIRVNATTLFFAWPARGLNEQTDITQAQKRVQQYFVNKSPDELRRHFTIVASEDAKRPGTYRLEMTPKRKQIQQGVAKLDLWLVKETLMLSAMRMTFPNGDSKTMTFDRVEMNVPVSVHD